jgi:hypothetical protein
MRPPQGVVEPDHEDARNHFEPFRAPGSLKCTLAAFFQVQGPVQLLFILLQCHRVAPTSPQ